MKNENLKNENLKKGNWQQAHHSNVYGNQFSNSKYFNLDLPDSYIEKYINTFYNNHNKICDIYEFGVYTGGTLSSTKTSLVGKSIFPNTIWGFDSFEGLPTEVEGRLLEGKHWEEGAFSASDALGIWDWSELEAKILKTIDYPNVKLVKGFYENTLNSELFKNNDFKPAMFVNIDVDLYKSTIEVLEWLFVNKIVHEGTLLRYDDVHFIPETEGELLAHAEMCKKYNIECDRLSKEYFLITKI